MPNLPSPKGPAGVRGALLAVLVGVALALTPAVPAQAATTYTPSGGPSVSFVGTNIPFTDVEAGQTFTCSSVIMAGSLVSSGVSRAYGNVAITLSTLSSSGCSNPICGAAALTPVSTWTFAITGDKTGTSWPARIDNVTVQLTCGGCAFKMTGRIVGTFDTATQRFTPQSGGAGFIVSSSPAPSGSMCVTLDIQAGDQITVGGVFVRSPSPGSVGVTISNP